MIILYITIFLFAGYTILIIYYWLGWRSIPEYVSTGETPRIKFSVIIPARNEDKNIVSCLESVCNQDYPPELLQVIVIDDCSTDKTWGLAKSFYRDDREISVNRLTEVENAEFSAHKKRAIQVGISIARNEFIITTDADCRHSPGWLKTIASFYQDKKSVLISAPVVFQNHSSLLQRFQALDFMVLQGITGASVYKKAHSMCNGANLSYEKQAFFEVNGFEGIDTIASGDDMLLMNKIWKKYPDRVHYLKSGQAVVSTQPMESWREFFNQRIRWASKARFYEDKRMSWVLLLVYLFNVSFLVLLIISIWNSRFLAWFAVLLFAKTLVEFPFVYSVSKFFNKQSLMKYFLLFQPLHIGYTIVAGWLGQFARYEWKGRRVR